jgi:hypothetical protein
MEKSVRSQIISVTSGLLDTIIVQIDETTPAGKRSELLFHFFTATFGKIEIFCEPYYGQLHSLQISLCPDNRDSAALLTADCGCIEIKFKEMLMRRLPDPDHKPW